METLCCRWLQVHFIGFEHALRDAFSRTTMEVKSLMTNYFKCPEALDSGLTLKMRMWFTSSMSWIHALGCLILSLNGRIR
jgi:hypothetical protein